MSTSFRKLIFNEADIHIIYWKERPCFFVSELSAALDSVSKDDIAVFLRKDDSTVKGIDYDVVEGPDAKQLKSILEDYGIKKRFVQTMIIYFEGLKKYLNSKRTIETNDFISYLTRSKVNLEEDFPFTPPSPQPTSNTHTQIPAKNKKDARSSKKSVGSAYSDFLKHISFMEEFVAAMNQLHIPADKTVSFTKSMVKFFEDHGMSAEDFLKEIKKWNI